MSSRRRMMLIALIPLFGVLFLGQVGTVELTIWLALVAVWIGLFFTWASAPRPVDRTPAVKHGVEPR